MPRFACKAHTPAFARGEGEERGGERVRRRKGGRGGKRREERISSGDFVA